ncbi:6-bladed beta-propeller [Roseivirga echinicomitans]|uniref:6-bladed beta-propeller n=1 Tax=Roseivirga echinicomitans TaxID=296218 RepID=A0A150XJB8_9BACT|nr:6-bladed beta-propeller [Roseivirga echinicomitans]KYG78781.1 hypothetical protein AWN68_03900 [Roseivirga echinicomitans]
MKRNLFSLLILTLVFSCAEKGGVNDKQVTNLDDFRTYAIDVESKATPVFDLIEEVEVMRLEETEESLLGDVYKLDALEGEYVITYPRTGDNHFFDRNGKFLRAFNNSGGGPKEYNLVLNSWIENDDLSIFDSQSMRVHKYTKFGNWIESKRIPYSAFSLAYYDSKYFLDVSRNPVEDDFHAVAVLNTKMELIETTVPFNDRKAISLSWGVDNFKPYKDGLVYNDVINDTVYVYENDLFRPLLSVDFRDKWIWSDRAVYSDFQKAQSMMQRNDVVYSFGSFVGERYVYVQHILNSRILNYLIDRETGEVQKIKSVRNGADKNLLIPIRWEGDRLLFSMRSTAVKEFLTELEEGQKEFREGTTLEEIESSENPVLMWVKFKEE